MPEPKQDDDTITAESLEDCQHGVIRRTCDVCSAETPEDKLQALSQMLYDALETRQRNNGDKFVCLKDGSPKWMQDVIHEAHGDKLPDDTTYSFCEEAAGAIAQADSGDFEDAIQALEPSVYTHDLTAWLHARADHIFYLTDALEQFQPDDGFKALAIACQIHMQEVGSALLAALRKKLEAEDE